MWRKLGAFEKAAAITGEKAVFNAVIVLKLDPVPSELQLQRMFSLLQQRHPLLRSCIDRHHGRRLFAPAGTGDIPISSIEASTKNTWVTAAEQELNTPFRDCAYPLVRVVRVTPAGMGPGEVIITLHHAIMDAPSAMNVIRELLLVRETDPGSAVSLPSAPDPAPEKHFPAHFRPPWGYLTSIPFLARSLADEIHCNGRRSIQQQLSGKWDARILSRSIPESSSRELYRLCRHRGISMTSLAGAAMLRAVHSIRHESRRQYLRHIAFADLRGHLNPPRTEENMGCCVSMLRLTLHLNKQSTLWETAAELQKRIQRAVGRGDRFAAALWSPFMMRALFRWRISRMATTALSLSDPLVLPDKPGGRSLLGLHAFVSNFSLGPEFTAQARLFRGRLQWDMVYLDGDMDNREASNIADSICHMLEETADERHRQCHE